MVNSLPSGTVTFLFTDIEGSTKLAQANPDRWESLRRRHHVILQTAMDAYNGYVFQIIGDSFCVAFNIANEAILAAIKSQTDLFSEDWGDAPVKVRMGIHTGQAQVQERGDYQGYLALSRVQRLMSAGHGGQILISMATQELVRDELSEKTSLRDMGERRLKDLIRPEHIYQLDIAGLPIDFPPLKTLDKYRHNLPTQLTSFIGREREIIEIKHALAEHRLVTLTGSGGSGKTRLSLQVAADSLDQFPSGVWFVELAPLTDPDLIPQSILSTAEVQTQQGKSALESLTDFLREKSSLLVLDNCEHLIDASAKLSDTLLRAAPNLKILASSREALGVQGEQSWRVPSLSAPDVRHLPPLEQISQYEAVRLFIDRALLVQPRFAVTNENAPAVAQICHRLDGIPLAIELAAARLRILSAEQLAARLDDRFSLLTSGSRTSLPRQQTLRALIDWSYDLLSESERTLLRRLAVFSGGCTLEAAELVCSDEHTRAKDILDLLTRLADKSLLAVEEQPGHLRYHILETVREYAREKLTDTNEGEKIRDQHLAYFLKFAEEAEAHLMRTEQLEWLERLDPEHDNFRSALEWAYDEKQNKSSGAALCLVNALFRFWLLRGYWMEAEEHFARALIASAKSTPTVAKARAFSKAAFFHASDKQQSLSLSDQGLTLSRELGDKLGAADALFYKAINIYWSDHQTGKLLLEESMNLYRELGYVAGMAITKYHLGQIASFLEYDPPTARKYYKESLALAEESGHRRMISLANMNLGDLAAQQGDLSTAQEFFAKSLSLGQELGDKHGIMMYFDSLGRVALGWGQYQHAEELITESLTIARELGSRSDIAEELINLARVARFQNNHEKSSKLLRESLAIGQEIADDDLILNSFCRLGESARLQGNHAEALSFHIDSLSLASKTKNRAGIARLLDEFAALNIEQGRVRQAATLLGAGEALHKAIHEVLLPVERLEVDLNIASARAQLDEDEFNAAYTEGHSMSMEQAVEYALKSLQVE